MKDGCLASGIVLAGLFLIGSCQIRDVFDKGSAAPKAVRTSSPEDCAGVMGSLKRSFPGPGYNNPKPGVFYMPPIVWASASQEDRKVVAQLLALQKGCELGADPTYVTVEIRSITDNRLLAKGPLWDLEEQ